MIARETKHWELEEKEEWGKSYKKKRWDEKRMEGINIKSTLKRRTTKSSDNVVKRRTILEDTQKVRKTLILRKFCTY